MLLLLLLLTLLITNIHLASVEKRLLYDLFSLLLFPGSDDASHTSGDRWTE